MVVGGKLVLKGGMDLKPKKKKKSKKRSREENGDASPKGSAEHASGSRSQHAEGEEEEEELVKVRATGRIISSGTTVHGKETKFLQEMSPGDAIVIVHPTTFGEEIRIIRMVLSDISMSISSAFSTDLISTTAFHYIKAPKEPEDAQNKEDVKKQKLEDEYKFAYGTYAGGTVAGSVMKYRVKKGGAGGAYGGYFVKEEVVDKPASREDLLDRRSKGKSDRHCY